MENNEHPLDPRIFEKADLILRYYQGELNAQESEKVEQWLAEDEANRQFAESLKEEDQIQEQLDFFSGVDADAAWEKVATKINDSKKEVSFWQHTEYLKYAAILLLVCLAGVWAYKKDSLSKNTGNKATEVASNKPKSILPVPTDGRSKAQLTLSNGSVIDLETQDNGTIWNKNGARITKNEKELHFYFSPGLGQNNNANGVNTLTTPAGGQYKITLPDGSDVWLNASSTLSFSNSFKKKNRVVELSGEAYFEVAKDKHRPFLVKANNTTVEVLGTHFNVMAYQEEKSINTTLLEGSVKVSNSNSHTIIKPGYQAKAGKTIEVEKVDVDAAVAWKKGLFQFQNTDLETIMRQLERWYGVQTVYQGQIPDQHFT
ncbi:MAG: FecR domain-containing protein, partial [Bacteroidota bacterium]|nr:FecR domain-containing protein [Bacteroidota bacterium]